MEEDGGSRTDDNLPVTRARVKIDDSFEGSCSSGVSKPGLQIWSGIGSYSLQVCEAFPVVSKSEFLRHEAPR